MFYTMLTFSLALLPDAEINLPAATKTTAAMASYRFTIEAEPGKGIAAKVEGKYQKGQPVWFKADKISFFRKGEALVYEQNGEWKRSKTGVESDPLLILGGAAKVRAARLPHEELAGFEKNLKEVKKSPTKDFTIFAGELTAD